MDLLFLKTPQDVERPEAAALLAKGYRPVPTMPLAVVELARRGHGRHRLPIEHIPPAAAEAAQAEGRRLAGSWHAPWRQAVTVNGVDCADCARLQLLGFFEDLAVSEAIWPALLREHRPRQAVFLRAPATPSQATTMHNGKADVFEAVLQYRLAQAGVETVVLAGPPAAKPVAPESAPPPDPRRIALEDLPSGTPLALAMGGGYDLLFLWPYVRELAGHAGLAPLLLNFGTTLDAGSLRSGLRPDAAMRFLALGDIPLAGPMPDSLDWAKRQCLDALRPGSPLPEALQNPLLAFQFEFVFACLVRGAARACLQAEYLFSHVKTRLFLEDYCADPAIRAFAAIGAARGVRTVHVLHGCGANLVEFFDFNTQYALCWGPLGKRTLEQGAASRRDRILAAGNPSMDALERIPPAPEAEPRAVMLVTGGFLQQIWTDFDADRFFETWEALFAGIAARPGIPFVVKPHPGDRDFGDWYRERIGALGLANLTLAEGVKMEDALVGTKLAILVAKPGTAALVSLLGGVPVARLDGLLRKPAPGYAPWRESGGLAHLASVKECFAFIDGLFADQARYAAYAAESLAFLDALRAPFDPVKTAATLGLAGTKGARP